MSDLPEVMNAMVLTGHGGLDKLEWRDDMPVPVAGAGEVLIAVKASAVNNTDINTRIGWYSKSVTGDTASASCDLASEDVDGGWSGALHFPRIQGADCCGVIVAVGAGVDAGRIGERVLVRAMQATSDADLITFGSECDGGFAQYSKCLAHHAVTVNSDWSDGELASIPCAYTTAEGMLQRVSLGAERVLITGASGGVGSAAVQLAKLRGAHVTAVTSGVKADAVLALGADAVVDRDGDFGAGAFDVVVDLVGGARFADMIDALARSGRYVVSGAIAGPIVDLDLRTLYLQDLTFFGSTYQPDNILPDVISYIEAGQLRPQVAASYALKDMKAAQEAFLAKGFVGKIVLEV